MPKRVLVVAQQTVLRAAIARSLLPIGYSVEIASTEKTARQLLRKESFEAAVVAASSAIDRELSFLREVESAVGKLVILAEGAAVGRQLTNWFSDALVCESEPLNPETYVSFIGHGASTAKRRERASGADVIQFEGCKLDLAGHVFLNAKGQEVTLTRGEFALLVAFVSSPGRVLSRAELRREVDGGRSDNYDRSIDMLVARLRRKIEPRETKAQFIVTVPGAGYKFVARVRITELEGTPVMAEPVHAKTHDAQSVERRQVAVLSCQILGFAALAAELDPEDLDAIISHVYEVCAGTITRRGGLVARNFGDNIVAYFGHPKAQENDAENALRAALELNTAIDAIDRWPKGKFRARTGIATGLMVIGELGSTAGREAAAVGEALNLAQHLQQAAAAGGVVMEERTRRLVGRLFDCREIAPVVIDDSAKAIRAWHVIAAAAGIGRFDALRREDMLPIVGREAEMGRLMQLWSEVKAGRGRVVILIGEAGIGKSRLIVELEEQLQSEAPAPLRYCGLPHRSDAPMAVILDELQMSADFGRDDSAALRLEKLRRQIDALGPAAAEAEALLAGLLSLPSDASPETAQLSPQKRKERIFVHLLARIASMASQRPVLAVVDDVQWADPTSLEFLTLLVERANNLRLLLLIVGRPEATLPWPDYAHLTTLILSRLSRPDSAALIHLVAADSRVAAAAEDEIISRAEGVPLFVEELTKSVLERLPAGDGPRARRTKAAELGLIPPTLHGLLLARFDRIAGAKEVAQAAAVIGRDFSYELLRFIAERNDAALTSALDQLVSSGLVFRRGSPPQASFLFKHALVRDAAYDMLVRERRQALHGSVARSYEELFPETAAMQPELLAYHWREAGDWPKTIGYLIAAAEQALRRSATNEALSHLGRAREVMLALPETDDRLQLELKLEISLGRALIAGRGYTAQETIDSYRRAHALCDALHDHYWLPIVLFGLSLSTWFAADYKSALGSAQALIRWGEQENVGPGRAMGHFLTGMTLTMMGVFAAARHHLERALAINEFTLTGRPPFLASDADGRITALMYLHTCLFALGFPEQAHAAARRALVDTPSQRYSVLVAQTNACRMHALERDYRSVLRVALEALQVSEQQGYPFFIGTSLVYRGWALAQLGQATEGVALCHEGIAKLRALSAVNWFPRYLSYLAECHEKAGDAERALSIVGEAITAARQLGEPFWEAELLRLQGGLMVTLGQLDQAEARFRDALALARRQEARLFELRAATSLADLLAATGDGGSAREALAPVYARFTEGFEFLDLREAKAFLGRIVAPQPAGAKESNDK